MSSAISLLYWNYVHDHHRRRAGLVVRLVQSCRRKISIISARAKLAVSFISSLINETILRFGSAPAGIISNRTFVFWPLESLTIFEIHVDDIYKFVVSLSDADNLVIPSSSLALAVRLKHFYNAVSVFACSWAPMPTNELLICSLNCSSESTDMKAEWGQTCWWG